MKYIKFVVLSFPIFMNISIGYTADFKLGFSGAIKEEKKKLDVQYREVNKIVPPSNSVAAHFSMTQIKLTWHDNSDNELGFSIERKVAGGAYSQIADVGANAVSYSDTGLTQGSTYYYRVYAYNIAGNSGYTNEVNNMGVQSIADMVYVAAGNFSMGQTGVATPVHTVYLDAYYIDKYLVTNAQYKLFIDSGGYSNSSYWTTDGWNWKTGGSYTQPSYWTDSTFGYSATNGTNLPVVGVSWYECYAYAKWAGKRLPTEAEWEKAARGTDGRTYPWGEGIDSTKCNYNNNIGHTTVVNNYPSGVSPYGCYDMAGNVWEWINDWFDGSYYSSSPANNPQGPVSGTYRVLRGGTWDNSSYYCRSACRYSGYYGPFNQNYSFGFRCAYTE